MSDVVLAIPTQHENEQHLSRSGLGCYDYSNKNGTDLSISPVDVALSDGTDLL